MLACRFKHFYDLPLLRNGAFVFKGEIVAPSFGQIDSSEMPIPESKESKTAVPAPLAVTPETPPATPTLPIAPEVSAEKKVEEAKNKEAVLRKDVDQTVEHLLNKDSSPENIAKVREILEDEKNKEKLAGFIVDHAEYNGDFSKWNKEFCDTFSLLDDENKENAAEAMRMVGTLQHFLADYFKDRKLFVGKGEKSPNRFLSIDGRLGGYTLSVLAEYWNQKYAKADVLAYAGLGKSFDANPNYKKGYGEALAYLKGQSKGAPITAPATPSAAVKESVAPVPQASLDPERSLQADALLHDIVPTKADMDRLDRNFEDQIKDFDWLRDEKGKDIHAWFWVNSFTTEKDSWPAKAYQNYERLFDEDNKAGRPLSKETLAAWDRLRQAIQDYRDQARSLHKQLEKSYGAKIKQLVSTYSLPAGANWNRLSPTITVSAGRASSQEKNPAYRFQEEKILPELRAQPALSDFLGKHFKEMPKQPPKEWADLEKTASSPIELEQYFSGLDRPTILKRIEAMIHLNNMYQAHKKTEELRSDYSRVRGEAMAKLNGSFEAYYRDFKGKQDTDFIVSVFEGTGSRS